MNIHPLVKIGSFILFSALLQCTTLKKSSKVVDDGQNIFFDDFSGATLDTTKWNVLLTGQVFNNELQAYVDSAATIYTVPGPAAEGAQNGALVLHPRYAPGFVTKDGKKFDFISGRIHTKDKVDFTYGSAQARIKMSEGTGLWPAWWLLGNGRWPQTGEIDIMEYIGQNEWTNAAVHGPGYSGNTPFIKRDSSFVQSPITNWHVYAVDWTPDSLVFKIDDRAYYTVTKTMVEKYGKWVFDTPKHLILNFAVGGAYPGGVNKIKEPYLGVPASTVDSIKMGKSKMLVDWVRVRKLR